MNSEHLIKKVDNGIEKTFFAFDNDKDLFKFCNTICEPINSLYKPNCVNLLYLLMRYLQIYYDMSNECNFNNIVELLLCCDYNEYDTQSKTTLDRMLNRLEFKYPNNIISKTYAIYKIGLTREILNQTMNNLLFVLFSNNLISTKVCVEQEDIPMQIKKNIQFK